MRQFLGSLLDLFKQSHIRDCDHRLVGEGLDRLDLPVGKWLEVGLAQGYCADYLIVAHQWHR